MTMNVTPFVEPANLLPYANQFTANTAAASINAEKAGLDVHKATLEIQTMGEKLKRVRELLPIEIAKAKLEQETLGLQLERAKVENSAEALRITADKILKQGKNEIHRLDEENKMIDIESAYGPAISAEFAKAMVTNDGKALAAAYENAKNAMGTDNWNRYLLNGQLSPLKTKGMLDDDMIRDLKVEKTKLDLEKSRRDAIYRDAVTALNLEFLEKKDKSEDKIDTASKYGKYPLVDMNTSDWDNDQAIQLAKRVIRSFISTALTADQLTGDMSPEHREMLLHLDELFAATPDTRKGLSGFFQEVGLVATAEWKRAVDVLPFTGTSRREAIKAYGVIWQLAKNPDKSKLESYLDKLRQLTPSTAAKEAANREIKPLSRKVKKAEVLLGEPAVSAGGLPPLYKEMNAVNREVVLDGKPGRISE